MTKLYVNTEVVKNNIVAYLNQTEDFLNDAYNNCNNMIIPEDYINLNYLNWCKDKLNDIKSSTINSKEILRNSNILFENTANEMINDINSLNNIKIDKREIKII